MPYTFIPKEKHANAFGRNLRISDKSADVICRVIKKKPLKRVKRLLNDLLSQKRSLGGKYYTKTVKEINNLLNSCEKNAEFLGMDADNLMVHASAHKGASLRRRRRVGLGSRIKSTNVEIVLTEGSKNRFIKKSEAKPGTKKL